MYKTQSNSSALILKDLFDNSNPDSYFFIVEETRFCVHFIEIEVNFYTN